MKLWAVTDGAAGNARQALALAQALADRRHGTVESVVVVGRYPWRAAAPRTLPGAAVHFDPTFMRQLDAQRPDVLVGCGRVAALATRLAGAAAGSSCKTVQILDPRLPGPYWDVRVVPAHDAHRDACTVVSLGSLHPVDEAWLAAARAAAPASAFAAPAPPLTALLLGGPTRRARWSRNDLQSWIEQIAAWPESRLWVIGSRRTPEGLRRWLRGSMASRCERLWLDARDGENPYAWALAGASRLVVSPDSVNMLSEAAATTASLIVPQRTQCAGRQRRFLDALAAARILHELEDSPPPEAAESPFRELGPIAEAVLAKLRA